MAHMCQHYTEMLLFSKGGRGFIWYRLEP